MRNQGEIPLGQSSETVGTDAPVDNKSPTVVRSMPASTANGGLKISKVGIVTKQSLFESLKTAMDEIGVTGMTVMQAFSCGRQKGRPEYCRGVEMEAALFTKD